MLGAANQTNWLEIVTAISAIGALLVSLGGLLVSIRTSLIHKRQTYASVFSNSRIDWIKCLRTKLAEFLLAYLEEFNKLPSERYKTIALKYEIDLYMDYQKNVFGKSNPEYINLSNRLAKYWKALVQKPVVDHALLVKDSQKVLASAFLRAKREAGITKKMDLKYWNDIIELPSTEDNN